MTADLAPDLAAQLAMRLDAARAIAREAGKILMGHYGRLASYDEKSPINLVTVADRESEQHIATQLRAAFPGDASILEEADGVAGAKARRAETDAAPFAWCVDPLDGTTNFVHGYPSFAVSIGLFHFGRPVLGVVHAPALGETYAGGIAIPATLDRSPIHVSKVRDVKKALLATGFPYDRRERLDALLATVKRALETAHDLRRSGSAALDLCAVACGRIDGFFEIGLSPWDVAAGEAIVRAAGGNVSAATGEAHDPYGGRIVATNGLIHDEVEAIAS
jgi:myo-inositol-1(or 4)-monophosphatase